MKGEKVLVSGLSSKRQHRNFLQESKSRNTVEEFREVHVAHKNCSVSLSPCDFFTNKGVKQHEMLQCLGCRELMGNIKSIPWPCMPTYCLPSTLSFIVHINIFSSVRHRVLPAVEHGSFLFHAVFSKHKPAKRHLRCKCPGSSELLFNTYKA